MSTLEQLAVAPWDMLTYCVVLSPSICPCCGWASVHTHAQREWCVSVCLSVCVCVSICVSVCVQEAHNAGVHALTFSHAGAYMATGSVDGLVKVWEAEQSIVGSRHLCTLRGCMKGVNSVRFDPAVRTSRGGEEFCEEWGGIRTGGGSAKECEGSVRGA